ncbi:MAG: M23 family metallopeptidase [Gammaproteobacteria bacterium]|nr:M23 family metallopeptidase [Gammaproteobacteria bacterium]MBQ0838294.1 M23 family metallopeptidase [Gammaproteobacteria bacterium]
MRIIFLSSRQGKSLTLTFNTWAKVALSLCVLGVPLGAGLIIGANSDVGDASLRAALAAVQVELDLQHEELQLGVASADKKIAAYSQKLAEIQARMVRMDALGERITDIAGLDKGEFDFSHTPAIGGPVEMDAPADSESIGASSAPDVSKAISSDLQDLFAELEARMDNREQQLDLLRVMIVDRDLRRENTISGRPIAKGWMSSRYGKRTDPFNGRKVWHLGVDFAGKEGSDVLAVASGIVTRSEPYKGYGRLIEIDHGEGYVTRYGHNKTNLVKVGDLVKKGQVISKMGSTGRSTGPHVHFEVYKNGRNVDPASYIRRTVR